MRANFPQDDGRAIARRKWSADKLSGPLVYFAELVLKRLIQNGFAASYERLGNELEPVQVRFSNLLGFTPLFAQHLRIALEITARRCRVGFRVMGGLVMLDGVYRLKLRYAEGKPVAAGFVRISDLEIEDPPF